MKLQNNTKFLVSLYVLAGVFLLQGLLFASSANAGEKEVWQYYCADGIIEVDIISFPKVYVWEDIEYDSHTSTAWGVGYTSQKSLSNAITWCKSQMRAAAIAKCRNYARMWGVPYATWWFETRAILSEGTWYYTVDGLTTTYHFPGIFHTVDQSTVFETGSCTGPEEPL